MNIIIKSPYPYLIKTSSQEIDVNENDNLLIEDEHLGAIFPLCDGQIPFYINFDALQENQFYSLCKQEDYLIILLNKQPKIKISKKERLNFSGKICDVFVDEKGIAFETSDKKIEFSCAHSLKNAKIFKLKDYACVQTPSNLYAFSVKKNKLSHFNGTLELNADTLKVTKNFEDSDGRIKCSTYKLADDILLENEEFIRNNTTCPQELVPYKMLESIKAKDYSRALDFLSDELKNHVDKDKICDFFGNFDTFLPISTTEYITLSPKIKNFVTFSLSGDKIEDINVDNL